METAIFEIDNGGFVYHDGKITLFAVSIIGFVFDLFVIEFDADDGNVIDPIV